MKHEHCANDTKIQNTPWADQEYYPKFATVTIKGHTVCKHTNTLETTKIHTHNYKERERKRARRGRERKGEGERGGGRHRFWAPVLILVHMRTLSRTRWTRNGAKRLRR